MTIAQPKIQETTSNVQSFANDYVSQGVANENNKYRIKKGSFFKKLPFKPYRLDAYKGIFLIQKI